MQVQNFALARQEVVLDVEPVHGLEMAAQDGGRDQIGDRGSLVVALPRSRAASRSAHLQVLLVLLVPLRGARVEIPAVVVEARLSA